jgi:hypothetical protein
MRIAKCSEWRRWNCKDIAKRFRLGRAACAKPLRLWREVFRSLLGAAPARLPTPTRTAARWGPRVRRASRLRAGWAGDPSPPQPSRPAAPPRRAPLRVGDPGFGGRAASLAGGGPPRLPARLRRGGISRPFPARFAPRAKGAAPASGPQRWTTAGEGGPTLALRAYPPDGGEALPAEFPTGRFLDSSKRQLYCLV